MFQSTEKLYKQKVDYYFKAFLLVYWLIISALLLPLLYYSLDYASLLLIIYLAVIGWIFFSEVFIEHKMQKYPEYEEYKLNMRKKKLELRLENEIGRMKKSYKHNI